ncbi:PREDICTED: WD repeat-containing protein 19 [Nicrophorus vespilloides]|uniref:WD repeat-containing protein 19 n=1 Tax=Nicrophorus vespilloides TaxID=110193 RepID=A0ABM1M520_NICVS|nr:PREDICTED: WD repeat-containing protein 19 [Nicrophorus vespilloides]
MGNEKLLFRLEQPHGPGDIYIAWQKGSGNYLATTGIDAMVNIFDRYGQIQERIRLQSLCSGFAWDMDGDVLGIISQSPQLILWDANTNKKQIVDVGLRDPMTCILWSKNAPVLAVGTSKGNVSIYNHTTSKRIPIIAKHTKKITCGAWNAENLLALGSEDKTISISNIEGDTLRVISLRSEPTEVQFSEMKLDERVGGENTVSVIVGKRTLYLFNLLDPENPIELAFQQHYGSLTVYKWFGDGYILLGFNAGYFIAISTHIKEVGQELFQIRNHKINLTDIALCQPIGKVASAGDNVVKIHDISNLQETLSVITLSQEIGVDRVGWSSDGQLLGVCTRNGSLNVYVSHMPTLTAVCGPRIAVLSSLTEVSLYNFTTDKSKLTPIPICLETEPQVISVGPYNLAVAMNNRGWFYDLTRPQPGVDDAPLMLKDRQYLGNVTSIKLNAEYASILFDGKIHLHMIEQPVAEHEERESIIFPDDNSPAGVIQCHALTTEFLIYGTDLGHIVYFCVEEWAVSSYYKHPVGIENIYVDPAGTRLIFFDVKSQGFLYNAVLNETLPVPELPNKVSGVTWDSNLTDRNVFIVYDENEIDTYLYVKFSVHGSCVKKIGKTTLASKQTPLLMYGGEIMSATSGGQLTQLTLSTHDAAPLTEKDKSVLENNFAKQLDLQRFNIAWSTCLLLNSKEYWLKLAQQAIINLDIDLAIRVYKQLDDVSMVWSLRELADIEDQRLLAGHIAMYLNDYDQAQIWFLKSSEPWAALEMRRDLLQWDQALQLAKKMAPDQIPQISREYAQQLEFTGNYTEAYLHFEKGLQETINQDHVVICKAGIARTAIRCGNYKHGVHVALELRNKQLLKECGEILESKKQLQDAATLYERSENYDKAAGCYIKLKNWVKVGEILPQVTSNRVHIQYAKAKENEGKYQEAAQAYYVAKDFDSVIRLQLEYLNNPEIAVELVQETKSTEGAKLVARFFQRLNDYPTAIRFLVLSKCHDEAFELARKHSKLQLYGEILLNSLDPDEIKPEYFNSLALYFENERNYLYAGKYWYHAKEYNKAMKHLLKASKLNSDENESISTAIDVVASSGDEALSNQLIEYLLGEVDGLPKDPKYLFRLYMARKQFKEASKSAVIIADEEQINGNYRNSHDVLFGMYQELKQNGIRIPRDMYANLMLLHSYILVRLHVKRSDHMKGARMLIRVANNISKFPSHIVPILTSAVIECHRAGLRQAAHKYATLLMKPEYRKQIDAKYSKKIEAVVRKPPKTGKDGEKLDDPSEPLTPCPYCGNELPESDIYCSVCKNNLPFCIVTGRHIIISDLTACPECDFPALYSEFVQYLEAESNCPMCSEKIAGRKLQKVDDFKAYLNFD